MGIGFMQLGGLLLFALPGRSLLDIAPPPTDVAPPPTVLGGLGLAVLAVLCLFVVGIGVAAFFVIRAIRKNRAGKEVPAAPAAPEQPKENS